MGTLTAPSIRCMALCISCTSISHQTVVQKSKLPINSIY